MKIYTKTGDQGRTSLLGGLRVEKSDPRIELLGTLDELNSVLGIAANQSRDEVSARLLERTQRQLFALGGELARHDLGKSNLRERVTAWTAELEQEMDQHTARLPPLANFILPGGSSSAATIHLARSICRRAERVYFGQPIADSQWVGVYVNRLGDWLFVLGRLVNQTDGKTESIWISGAD